MTDATPPWALGDTVPPEQKAFLDEHGYLHFRGVLTADEIEVMRSEIDRVASEWTQRKRKKVKGVPLFYGYDHQGAPFLQRLAYVSCFSERIHAIISDGRFDPIVQLVGRNARIGHDEKDGTVVNRNMNVRGSIYPRLGWHTDGLRDLFYLRKPKRMLNVGLHFDHVTRADGGLRLIPGTHHQSMVSTATRKMYFVDHRPDNAEIAVETQPGDLTVHDGRLWHRVARSSKTGAQTLRRTMYMPFINDAPNPRTEESKTLPYHYLGQAVREGRNAWYRLQRGRGRV